MSFPQQPDRAAPDSSDETPYPDDFHSVAAVVEEQGHELLALANVVRVGVGFKIIGGQETHRRCVTVFVDDKRPVDDLAADDVVPLRFHLHPTDVVELDSVDPLV